MIVCAIATPQERVAREFTVMIRYSVRELIDLPVNIVDAVQNVFHRYLRIPVRHRVSYSLTLLDVCFTEVFNPSTDRSPVCGERRVSPVHNYTACLTRTHRNPSCRRNSARLVPLLQNRIAYDRVLIVAACPAGTTSVSPCAQLAGAG